MNDQTFSTDMTNLGSENDAQCTKHTISDLGVLRVCVKLVTMSAEQLALPKTTRPSYVTKNENGTGYKILDHTGSICLLEICLLKICLLRLMD